VVPKFEKKSKKIRKKRKHQNVLKNPEKIYKKIPQK